MRRRLLVACVLLVAGAGIVFTLTHLPAASSPLPPVSAIAPDAIAPAAPIAAAPTLGLALGMGSGTSDILSRAMAASVRAGGIRVLRFGDIGADDYDWQGGCIYGDVGSRRECYGIAGQGGKLDQFLAFAGQVRAQPLLVVNGEVDDPQQAAGLVAYYWQHCAHPPHAACPDPYWEIGDSPATWKHFAVPLTKRQSADAQVVQPDQYAALVVAYAAAMQQASPYYRTHKIKIVADEWITGATDQSWIDSVTAVDTHYAPLLYGGQGPEPSAEQVLQAVERGYNGRPGFDSWLQDLRDSLAQFSQSGSVSVILGRWSIDANVSPAEPDIYGTYAQALFTAQMIAHVWQDAQPNGHNPLVLALQSPITGQAQEPFDITSLQPRAAVAVYALIGRYFDTHPLPLRVGEALREQGVTAAAALAAKDDVRLLLVNTDRTRARTIQLAGMPSRSRDLWWIVADPRRAAGVSAVQHRRLTGRAITLPPWSIAVARLT